MYQIAICLAIAFLTSVSGCTKTTQPLSENSGISSITSNSNSSSSGLSEEPVQYYMNQYANDNGSSVSFGVTKSINLYEPGEKIEYYFILKGDAYKQGKATVTFYNKKFEINDVQELTFKAGTGLPVTGSFTATKNGVYRVKLEIPDTRRTMFLFIGVYPKAKQVANSSFYYGIQPYLAEVFNSLRVSNREGYSVLWQTIDWLGCNLIRDGVSWTAMQDDTDSDVKFTMSDRLVKDADKRGIVLDWLICGTPEWAVSEKYMAEVEGWSKPPDLEAWEKYIKAVAEHYKDSDNIFYEIWNEPDWEFWTGTIEEYLAFLELSAKTIKAADPNSYVFPGGMASGYDLTNAAKKGSEVYYNKYKKLLVDFNLSILSSKDSSIYYKKYKELLDRKLIDNYAIHVHGPFDDQLFFDSFERIDNLTDAAGLVHNKSFITEAGTWNPNDEEQAVELMGKVLWSRANDYKMFVAYTFRAFDGVATRDWFDMMSSNLEPRESFIAYANLIHMLGQAEYKEKIADQKSLYADIYQAGSQFIVPVFSSVNGDRSLRIREGLEFEAFDILGNEVAVINNQLTVTKSVVYLVFNSSVAAGDFTY